jgi:hypothetical protein
MQYIYQINLQLRKIKSSIVEYQNQIAIEKIQ